MTAKLMTANRSGHIQWLTDGTVRATFFVRPRDYGLRAIQLKKGVRESHEIFAKALRPGQSATLLGLQVPLLDTDVRDRMLAGVDLDNHPDFIEEAAASYERIKQYSTGNRLLVVSVNLGDDENFFQRVVNKFKNNRRPNEDISNTDHAYWYNLADEFVSRVAASLHLEPAPEDCLPFIWNHNLMRGVRAIPLPLRPTSQTVMTPNPMDARFNSAVIDEGGRAVSSLRDWRSWFQPFIRIVPVDNPEDSSYQSILTVKNFPFQGAWFPGGSEFLSRLDGLHEFTADWAMRITRRPREEALQLNTRALRKLAEQAGERSDEEGFADQEIGNQFDMLGEYNAILSQRDDSDEISFTTAIAIGARSTEELRGRVATVRARVKNLGIKLKAPRGGQADLWNMFNPGAPDSTVYDDYAHITTSDMWAALVPFTTARILDEYGPIIGINLLSGLYEPLHFDLTRITGNDRSACVACCGELGSGKSYFLKGLAGIVGDLGGQWLAFDRSEVGEWQIYAESHDSHVVLDFTDPRWSIDPLRLLKPGDRNLGGLDAQDVARLTLDTLLPLLNISPTSRAGWALANMLREGYRKANPDIVSMLSLYHHIERAAAAEPHRTELADLVQAIGSIVEIAPALFDETLPPLPLDRTAIVLRTFGLSVPTAEQMTNPDERQNLPTAARLGQAYYTFGALLARNTFLRSNGRLGALIVDEAHHITTTAVGKEIIGQFVRDGRKHDGTLFIASHDPVEDFPGGMFKLIPIRIAFRHIDPDLARNALEWVGADLVSNPGLIESLTDHTSPLEEDADGNKVTPLHRRGECFVRGARGEVGRAKMLGPARPDRAKAASSSLADTRAYHAALAEGGEVA